MECGNSICLVNWICVPRPTPQAAVSHSPTPSTVKIADSSKGEHRNALAACERWCSEKSTRSRLTPNSDCSVLFSEHHLSHAASARDGAPKKARGRG